MKRVGLLAILGLFLLSLGADVSLAQSLAIPGLKLQLGDGTGEGYSTVVKLVLLLTVLSLAPAILVMMTSFTRVVVVLAFLKQALGTQTLPPNQMVIGMAMFITFFVMAPVFQEMNQSAVQPYISKQINEETAFKNIERSLREFMFGQTAESDIAMFVNLSRMEKPESRGDVPTWLLVPSFMISELKRAFQIGFMIYLPFLILDMVVASVLMAMGMMMLPPVLISLPFKILLFVLVDGWQLIVGSLVKSFGS